MLIARLVMAIMLVLTLFRHVRSCSRIDSRYTLIFNEVTLVCYLVSCEDVSWFCTSCTSMWPDLLLTLLASRNRVPSMLAPPSLHTPNIFPFCFFNQQVKINTPLLVCSICTYQVLIFLFLFCPVSVFRFVRRRGLLRACIGLYACRCVC